MDFWKPIRSGVSTDLMIQPNTLLYFSAKLQKLGIDFEEKISDVGALIQSQKLTKEAYDGKISFDKYYSHSDVSKTRFLQVHMRLHLEI